MLRINTRVMFKIKGKGDWEVVDNTQQTKFLFRTKTEANNFAKDKKLLVNKRG